MISHLQSRHTSKELLWIGVLLLILQIRRRGALKRTTIHNSHVIKSAWVPISGLMGKEIVVYIQRSIIQL
jgi:hypothetical protein